MSVGADSLGRVAADWLHGVADPVKLCLLRVLNEVEEATTRELGAGCRASAPTVRRHLDAMVATGIVAEEAGESDGLTPGRPAARFRLVPEMREKVQALLRLSPSPPSP
jgi:predicted ArsR family transcriptional regulator